MSTPSTPQVVIDRTADGQIVGGRTVGVDTVTEFKLERTLTANASRAVAEFVSGSELIVRLACEISVADESISLDVTDVANTALWWHMGFSNYEEDHRAQVRMYARGLGEFSGVYDPRIQRTNLQLAPDLWLSDTQRSALEPFRPVFVELIQRLDAAIEPDSELIQSTIMNSRWRALGGVACRAFAVMAGTAMGAALGGPIGAVAGAGVGSVASDGCSRVLRS